MLCLFLLCNKLIINDWVDLFTCILNKNIVILKPQKKKKKRDEEIKRKDWNQFYRYFMCKI